MDMEMCKLCFTMTASQQPVANSPFSQEFHKFKFIGLQLGYDMPESICGQCLIQLNQLGSFLKVCKDSFHIYKLMRSKQQKSLLKEIKQEDEDVKIDLTNESENFSEAVMLTAPMKFEPKSENKKQQKNLIKEIKQEDEEVKIDLTNESENFSETVMLTESMEFEPKSENQTDYSYCHTDGVDLEEVMEQVTTCQTCNEDVVTLFDHYKESQRCNPKYSKCPFCDAYFRNSRKLLLHQTSRHPDEASKSVKKCDICSKSFNCQDSLSRHLQQHDNHNQYACDQSGVAVIEDESGIKNSLSQKPETDNVLFDTLPQIFSHKFEMTYKRFMKWRKRRKMTSYSENVVMGFCRAMSKTQKMYAVWSQFYQLRSMLFVRHNVDLTKYVRVRSFLRPGPLDSNVLTPKLLTSEEIQAFLKDAPDTRYLLTKAVLAFITSGACRKEELGNLTIDDLEESNSAVRVTITHVRTRVRRTFVITGEFFNIYTKYASFRPPDLPHNRFFIHYKNGECLQQPVGKSMFGHMARDIASFLGLPEPKAYIIISLL